MHPLGEDGTSKTPAIAGTISAVFFIALVTTITCCILRRRKAKGNSYLIIIVIPTMDLIFIYFVLYIFISLDSHHHRQHHSINKNSITPKYSADRETTLIRYQSDNTMISELIRDWPNDFDLLICLALFALLKTTIRTPYDFVHRHYLNKKWKIFGWLFDKSCCVNFNKNKASLYFSV